MFWEEIAVQLTIIDPYAKKTSMKNQRQRKNQLLMMLKVRSKAFIGGLLLGGNYSTLFYHLLRF